MHQHFGKFCKTLNQLFGKTFDPKGKEVPLGAKTRTWGLLILSMTV
jgi:hypothetical protein